ncbi:extracellular solute-binding protein [Antribacter gilvus]|uniref:extracellular solute-binding protein n=1 Tax=Antribacter gilvus TaxID=2304675 RepID=UPI000F790AA4|nr:extracellular solute-binding protein [Antribacter gilvus]
MLPKNETRGVTRRDVLGVAAGLGAGAVLGVLGSGAIGVGPWWPGREREPEQLPAGERLTVLSGRDETTNHQRRLLVETWNALHPDRPAQMVELSGNADLAWATLHTAAQERDPRYDVYNLDIPWIPQFAALGYLRPLDDVDTDGFVVGPREAGRWDGRLWALPFNTDVGLLYYRPSLLERAGVPLADQAAAITTWDDLLDVARGVRELGLAAGGIALQLADYEGFTVHVLELLLGSGARPVTADGDPRVAEDSRTRRVLELLGNRLSDDTVLSDSLTFDESASLDAFVAGRTAFLRHWPVAHRTLSGVSGLDVAVAPLPGGGLLGGQSLAVSAWSRYPVAAQELAEFLTGERSQQILRERGGFAAARPEPYYDRVGATPDPQAATLLAALQDAHRRPALVHWSRFSDAFHGFLHRAYDSGQAPDLDALQERLDTAVSGRTRT